MCGARVHDATVLAVYPNFLRRVAPQPSHVEYKPAAVAEAADASNQPGREVQVPVQRDDSHDDTLAFVEAVAARFSGALVGLEVSSASLDVAVLQLHAFIRCVQKHASTWSTRRRSNEYCRIRGHARGLIARGKRLTSSCGV